MIEAILIDDEPSNNLVLASMLKEYFPGISIIGVAENCRDAVKMIKETTPHLVFLDIEMPYGNAFDLLDQCRPWQFEVIFVTAFDEYALKALRYNALDYLLKPVDIEELKNAVSRVFERIRKKKDQTAQIEFLLNSFQQQHTALEKIALPVKDSLIFVNIADIIRCEARAGYTIFYIKEKGKLVSTRNIREFEELLPDDIFIRIHNSHLVSLNYIVSYSKGRGGVVEMSDGSRLEVAIRRKDDLLAKFGFKKQ